MRPAFSCIQAATVLFVSMAPECCAQGVATPAAGAVQIVSRTPGLAFERWTDPNENAFWADVPKGWKVSGGLVRRSPINARPLLEAASPDGMMITLGPGRIPTFLFPSYVLNRTGYTEGSQYPNGYGGFDVVRRLVPGVAFAEEWARGLASANGCSQFEVLERRDRPDLAASINQIHAPIGAGFNFMMGEVAFTCKLKGQPMKGYYFAGTVSTAARVIWAVQNLHGFFAPAPKAGVAQAALRRLVASHRENPQWVAMQSRINRNSAQITRETNDRISRIISDTYWNRARATANAGRMDANARRGATDVVDPNTGETFNIYGGYNYYWRKPGSEQILGTNAPNPPGVGYYQVNEW